MTERPKADDVIWWKDLNMSLRVVELDATYFKWDLVKTSECWSGEKYADANSPGDPSYPLKGNTRGEDTDDINEAERLVAGVTKRDGLSELYFAPEHGSVYIGGLRDCTNIGMAIERVYDFARKHMERFESDPFASHVVDDVTAAEHEFGAIVGLAFRRGEGAEQHRFAIPLRRETAGKLYECLGRLLFPNAWGPRCEKCERREPH